MHNINLDNPVELASAYINRTSRSVFLTGKAGTGKTTFLKQIVQTTHKKCVVAAPTGIAAINAGGVTLHSLFQLPFGAFVPGTISGLRGELKVKINDRASLLKDLQLNSSKRNLLRELELLIIDEVSMLRADLLDAIDVILRSVRKNHRLPFGGLQILFIGDLLQLPPVKNESEWEILKNHYNSIYFFDALVLRQSPPIMIELTKIHRQSDEKFVELLNKLRENKITKSDVDFLNTFHKPLFRPSPEQNYITLTTHNVRAEQMNKSYLQEIKSLSYFYKAKIEGDFNENTYPLEEILELKTGAQVMFIKNDTSGEHKYFNGKIGNIQSLDEKNITVFFSDTQKQVKVELYEWQNVKYQINKETGEIEEKIVGKFFQYPIKLAWAITVHKSQGLTFDRAIIDIDKVFAPGQAYVALSRLRSMAGLILNEKLNDQGIQTDSHVKAFSEKRVDSILLGNQLYNEQIVFVREKVPMLFTMDEQVSKWKLHEALYQEKFVGKEKVSPGCKTFQINTKADEVLLNSGKFLLQLQGILNAENPNLNLVKDRLIAANGYFIPIFESLRNSLLNGIKEFCGKKRAKNFVSDLIELEAQCFFKECDLRKALVIVESIINQDEIKPELLKSIVHDPIRAEKLRNCMVPDENTIKENEARRQKRREKRKLKTNSDEPSGRNKKTSAKQSYSLFNEGMNITEIAVERGMTEGTIENHLVRYVADGTLSLDRFVSKEKARNILLVAQKLNSNKLGEIKAALGDEYTYGEIKFTLAGS